MEYCVNGTLYHLVKDNPLPSEEIRDKAKQVGRTRVGRRVPGSGTRTQRGPFSARLAIRFSMASSTSTSKGSSTLT